jgi:DNA (cytosine-5)-methyltransferase 1
VAPPASIIDWDDLGPRIGERAELGLPVLVANTRERIRAGILKHHPHQYALTTNDQPHSAGQRRESIAPLMITVTHSGVDDRSKKVTESPFPTRTVKRGDRMLTLPQGAFVDVARKHATGIPLTAPVQALSTTRHHGLVIPYRQAAVKTTTEPVLTLATKDSAALVTPTTPPPMATPDTRRSATVTSMSANIACPRYLLRGS